MILRENTPVCSLVLNLEITPWEKRKIIDT